MIKPTFPPSTGQLRDRLGIDDVTVIVVTRPDQLVESFAIPDSG
jgi:hypothetical protein